jgi:hypothetical protein
MRDRLDVADVSELVTCDFHRYDNNVLTPATATPNQATLTAGLCHSFTLAMVPSS